MVEALAIGKEICEDNHLCNYWTILQYLLFDIFFIFGNAIVNHLIEGVIGSALI